MARIIDVATIVRDAGGKVVGKTRLQKLAFLLEIAGYGHGFPFDYRRFGPFSQELATAARDAKLLGFIAEDEKQTARGGTVSIFSTRGPIGEAVSAPSRNELAEAAANADSIELELAATSLFLHLQGEKNSWVETARRKPDKARDGRLENAKQLYERLRSIPTPTQLPTLR